MGEKPGGKYYGENQSGARTEVKTEGSTGCYFIQLAHKDPG